MYCTDENLRGKCYCAAHTIALPIWKCSFLLNLWCKEEAIASKEDAARESSARILRDKQKIHEGHS